jgi:hypothetical protein
MDADEHRDDDSPPSRSTSGSPITAPEHRVRSTLVSWFPDIAAAIARFIGENMNSIDPPA